MSFAPSRLRPLYEQAMRLREAGYGPEADRLADQILRSPAQGGEDFHLQAHLLMQMGRFREAAARLDHALALDPATPERLADRAVALAETGRLAEAVASCEQALALRPDFVHAHFLHGDLLRELDRPDEALAAFDRALALDPGYVPALMNRAAVLGGRKLFEQALADYDRLLSIRPGDPEILCNRGQILGELFRLDEALESLERALAVNPRHVKALHDRGVVLWNLDRFAEALASYDKALALQPNLPVTRTNRANVLQDLLRLDEAMAAHDQVVAQYPDYASGHWNRSQGLLLRERWDEGLREFEWRKRRPESRGYYVSDPRPEWLGQEDLNGKTLFVRAEQGLGDSLQFCRYLALAQARGAHVVFAVHDALKRLMQSLEPPVERIGLHEVPAQYDHYVAMMSLPLAFGTDMDKVPAQVPYLKAEAERVAAWRARIGDEGFRIGISWRGGGRGPADIGRAFPVTALAGMARLAGVRLISLQKGAELPPGLAVETLTDFDQGPDAFLDTAAVMENLDLVISSDTAVAHLAGALGRPTWLALKRVPEWRWRLQGETTPWYPTMRLFRQRQAGDWTPVFAAMEAALADLLAAR